jgi:N-acetylneuraminic acid mutarotase
MPTARFDLGLAAASNGKVYAIGGMDDKVPQSNPAGNPGNILATVEEYDPATDTWASKKPIPTGRILQGLAAANNGKLYAIGGAIAVGPLGSLESLTVGTVEEYDPETDTWTTKAPMPTARYAPAAVANNGRLYIVGGVVESPSSFEITAAVEEYDPATDSWVTKRPLPAPRGNLALAAASNGKVYAIGGIVRDTRAVSGFSAVPTVEEYDPATDTWTTKTPMPIARSSLGLAAASDGKLYAIGGSKGPRGDRLTTVEAYDPTTDSWVTVTQLSTPRASLGVTAASNGKLYAIGGGDTSNALATVEGYTP